MEVVVIVSNVVALALVFKLLFTIVFYIYFKMSEVFVYEEFSK